MDAHKKAARSHNRRGSKGVHSRRNHSTRRRLIESSDTQGARLLAYLVRRGSVSTLEARGGELRIMHPAGRVYELRERGFDIYMLMDEQQGCGRYYLRGGAHAIDE